MFSSRLKWIGTTANPYGTPDIESIRALLDRLFEERFDLILTTTFNRTYLDELIAGKLKNVTNYAVGRPRMLPYGVKEVWQEIGLTSKPVIYEFIKVDEFVHEIEKYRQFWQHITSQDNIPKPFLIAPEEWKDKAKTLLSNVAFKKSEFYICAPAGTANVKIKAWPADRFADVIAWMEIECGLRALIIGHEKESHVINKVRDLAEKKGASPKVYLGKSGELLL